MNVPTIEQVDAAVRAVLVELGRARARSAPGRECFAGRLLAARHVEQLPEDQRALALAPGTVITPLARDLLKQRGILFQFVSGSEAGGLHLGDWAFAIETSLGVAAALRRGLLEDSAAWSEIEPGQSVGWVASVPGRGLALLTDQASVSVWRACQAPGVRAAFATDAGAVARAVRHLGVNYLAIEPAGQTIHSIKHMLAVFRRAGAPRAPEAVSTRKDDDDADRGNHRPGDAVPVSSQRAARSVLDRLAPAPGRVDGRFAGSRRGGDRVR
jgi:hypothetical protein